MVQQLQLRNNQNHVFGIFKMVEISRQGIKKSHLWWLFISVLRLRYQEALKGWISEMRWLFEFDGFPKFTPWISIWEEFSPSDQIFII